MGHADSSVTLVGLVCPVLPSGQGIASHLSRPALLWLCTWSVTFDQLSWMRRNEWKSENATHGKDKIMLSFLVLDKLCDLLFFYKIKLVVEKFLLPQKDLCMCFKKYFFVSTVILNLDPHLSSNQSLVHRFSSFVCLFMYSYVDITDTHWPDYYVPGTVLGK